MDYFGGDASYADFQQYMAENPDAGSVIPGVSPLRKVRWADGRRGKGKRGGLRVIYIHVAELRVLYLLDVYDKDEADDLTQSEKRELRSMSAFVIEGLYERRKKGML